MRVLKPVQAPGRAGLIATALLITSTAIAAGEARIEEIPITTASDPARLDFLAAQAAIDSGDAAIANALLRDALSKDPNFTYAWVNLGVVSFSPEEFADTVKHAVASAAASSAGEQMLVQIAQRFLDNDFTGQLAIAKQLTEKYPNSPRAWQNLAFVQGGLNLYEDQRRSFERAIQLDPGFMPGQQGLGNSYLFNAPRDLAQAEKYYRQAIAVAPGERVLYWGLGDVFRAANRLEDAREYYRRATLLDPQDGVAPLKLGHIDSFLGRYDDARADYDRGLAHSPLANRPFNANFRIFSWVHAGDPQTAIRELERLAGDIDGMGLAADQRTGAKAFTLTNAVTVALHYNRHDDARRLLDELSAVLRANAKAVGTEEFSNIQEALIAYYEGQLAAHRGDYKGALKFAKKNAGLVAKQSNPRKMENYNDLVGLISLLQGQYAAAVKSYRGADVTNQIYVKYHLALALDGAGQKDEAKRLFAEVGAWNFNTVQFALVRKDALARAS
jgi:tetratricopeptide (TPR) repeat protein